MFVSFGENGLVTCSADHLLILWKNGERQSHLRSLALFEKLEESGGLWPLTFNLWIAALKPAEVMLSMLLMIYCDDCGLYWMITWWLLFVSSLKQSIKWSFKNSKVKIPHLRNYWRCFYFQPGVFLWRHLSEWAGVLLPRSIVLILFHTKIIWKMFEMFSSHCSAGYFKLLHESRK